MASNALFSNDHEKPIPTKVQLGPSRRGAAPTSERVRLLIDRQNRRTAYFEPDYFGEPAWIMLLELYAAQLDMLRVTVTNLCHVSGAPSTTALRWIARLERDGLVLKQSDPLDARRLFVSLSERGSVAMERFFISGADGNRRIY